MAQQHVGVKMAFRRVVDDAWLVLVGRPAEIDQIDVLVLPDAIGDPFQQEKP